MYTTKFVMSSYTSNVLNTRGANHVNNMPSSRAPPKGARHTVFDIIALALPKEPVSEPVPVPKLEPVINDTSDNVTVVSSQSNTTSQSKATSRSLVLDSESFNLLQDFVKRVTPDSNTIYSIQGALKTRHDWAGRVLVNENITRSPLRVIAKNPEGFSLLKKRIINAFTNVLGNKVFVSISVYDVEQVPTQVFLKIRVSRMRERVTEASVAPVTNTEVKPTKAPKAPKVKAYQSRFAALEESDTDDE